MHSLPRLVWAWGFSCTTKFSCLFSDCSASSLPVLHCTLILSSIQRSGRACASQWAGRVAVILAPRPRCISPHPWQGAHSLLEAALGLLLLLELTQQQWYRKELLLPCATGSFLIRARGKSLPALSSEHVSDSSTDATPSPRLFQSQSRTLGAGCAAKSVIPQV